MGNDRRCCPCIGADFGRLDLGQLALGMDFLYQYPNRDLSASIAWKQLRHRETEIIRAPIDYVGLVLMIVGVGALQMMLDRGKELDWFASGRDYRFGRYRFGISDIFYRLGAGREIPDCRFVIV